MKRKRPLTTPGSGKVTARRGEVSAELGQPVSCTREATWGSGGCFPREALLSLREACAGPSEALVSLREARAGPSEALLSMREACAGPSEALVSLREACVGPE